MKKIALLILSIAILTFLVACTEQPQHTHNFGEWEVTKNATCTEDGAKARYCDCGEAQSATVPSKGHTEVIDKAIDPTCTATGLTAGSHCSVCKEVLVKQGTVPVAPHSYDDKYDDSCNVCGGIRDTECAHREIEAIPGYASTCTESGLTQGQKCKKCGEIITHQTVIDAKGHSEVIDKAIDPTCTSTGLTEGKHCANCDKVLVKQSVVPALPHAYGEWVVTKAANCGQDGEMTRTCSCGAKQTEIVYGSGMHGEVIDPAVSPTCTATGLTEGKHCPYCDTVFVKQEVIPTTEHQYNTTYSSNGSFHWYACKDCGTEKDKAEHQVLDDGMCSVCDQPIGATEGIIYDKSEDGTYAMVVAYTGSAEKIRIADTYQGLPVKTIYDSAFEGKYITSVIIPDSVTSIGSGAFYDCSSLSSVVIGDSVTSIGESAFAYCSSLSSVVISNSVTSIGDSAFSNCSSLSSVVIPDSVTSIGDWAFSDCVSLSSVVIGDSVTSIGVSAFYGCSQLQFNEYGNCKYLGSKDNPYHALIEVTTQNLSSYTIHEDARVIADYAFSSCSRLTSIVIGDSVTSIGASAFNGCDSLSSVVIPDSVTSIGNYAFYVCSSLSSVVIGDSVTSIGNYAFSGCSGISSVVIPDSVTSIGSGAFYDCSSLSSVVIGDSVTSIGDSAFSNCSSLSSVVIPDSVTSIGDGAFWDCSSLSSVVIPDSVTSIGESAFSGCYSLKDVYYTGSKAEWKAITIGDYNYDLTGSTIHYNYVPEN